jgi:DNA helicase-2/ATP-dependent DNA helicase PcrA
MVDFKLLTDWARDQGDASDESLDHDALPAHTLIEAIDHLADIAMPPDIRGRLEEFAAVHRRLVTVAQGVSLVELVRQILSETHAWTEIDAMPDASRLSARLNVHRFLDLAEDWSPLEGRPSLDAFLAYLELMQEEQIEELDTARVGTDDAVTLLTVHRAKGLEWPAVFIPALYHNNFPSSVRSYEDPYEKPAVIPNEMRLDQHERPAIDESMDVKDRRAILKVAHQDQEWRLAYVAVTRAERHLTLTGASWYGNPSPNKNAVKPSSFLTTIRALEGVETLRWVEEPGERPPVVRAAAPGPGPDPHFGMPWDAAMRAALADSGWARRLAMTLGLTASYDEAVDEYQTMLFSLPEPAEAAAEDRVTKTSVTGLVTYATCPKRFYWSEIDRLPRRPSSAARRGVELHRQIELHNRGNIPLDDADDLDYDAVDADADADAGTEAETDARPAAGRRSSFQTFKDSRFGTVLPVHVEAPFDLRVGDGAWIRGRIDAIYPTPNDGWEIVDFKSGRNRHDPAAAVQLQAYALAVTAPGFTAELPDDLQVTFAYFGEGLDEVTETVDAAWLAEAESRVTSILEQIDAQVWDPTPSAACRICDFQRFCDAGQAWAEENPD